MKDAEQKLRETIEKLNALRARVKDQGYKTPQDDAQERRLVQTYRRLVECGC